MTASGTRAEGEAGRLDTNSSNSSSVLQLLNPIAEALSWVSDLRWKPDEEAESLAQYGAFMLLCRLPTRDERIILALETNRGSPPKAIDLQTMFGCMGISVARCTGEIDIPIPTSPTPLTDLARNNNWTNRSK